MSTVYTFRSYAAGVRTWTRTLTPSFRAFDATSSLSVSGLQSMLRPESRRSLPEQSGSDDESRFEEAVQESPRFPTSLGKLYTSVGQMEADA